MTFLGDEMSDKTSVIFGNAMKPSVVRKAEKTKKAFLAEFGDDSGKTFILHDRAIPELAKMGVRNLMVSEAVSDGTKPVDLSGDGKALVVGNIRMGFGHYRISIAIASAARSMGFHPYLFDLHSFSSTTGGRIIAKLNKLYSLGSRLSQKYPLFNKLYWEPLNSEGFRKIAYNAVDQKIAELMATPCRLLPPAIPYVATHVWPSQAAVHAGMTHVVNAIPDNWPMGLHLSEGAVHCVQSASSWFGYKTLNGMDGCNILKPMADGSLVNAGHYIDHEIVSNLEGDTAWRLARLALGKPLRVLLTVGGAGAQRELFASILRSLLPMVDAGKVVLFINVGDHRGVLDGLREDIPSLADAAFHSDNWDETRSFAEKALIKEVRGVHLFYNTGIFSAVYATNVLMRASDLLITKPSELAFYPIPKLHIRRIGGHEAWGAIRSAEVGDGTIECPTIPKTLQMLNLLLNKKEALTMMNGAILSAYKTGTYSGAYRAVELAVGKQKTGADK
jgi:hypothetical protein